MSKSAGKSLEFIFDFGSPNAYLAMKILPDLLDRARKPLLEAMTKARRENSYWLPYVSEATSQEARLDRSRKSIAIVEAATPADLETLAQRYLRDDKALVIKAISDKAGK